MELRPLRARSSVPIHIEAAVDRALEKLPADRPATARDFAEALQGRGAMAVSADPPRAPAPLDDVMHAGRRFRLRVLLPWVLLVVALGGWAWSAFRTKPGVGQRARFALMLGDSARLRMDMLDLRLAISPDGSQLAYVGGSPQRLFLRSLDDLVAKPIAGTENAAAPQFSPDGQWLAFVVDGRLKKLPLSGGPAATIADEVVTYTWGANDVVVFSHRSGPRAGLWRVSAAGGAIVQVTRPDSAGLETSHVWPYLLPGAEAAVFVVRHGTATTDSLAVVRLRDRLVTRLGISGTNPRYAAPGILLYGRTDGTVTAVPFDATSQRVTGAEVPVIENVLVRGGGSYGGSTNIAISANGTLVYARGHLESHLVRVDRAGKTVPLRAEMENYTDPRFSPDGRRIAMTIQSAAGGSDLWVLDISAGTMTRLTRDTRSDRPAWTPDGRHIAWRVTGAKATYDTKWMVSDGSGTPEMLVADAWSVDFASSGKFLAVNTVRSVSGSDVDLVTNDSAHRRTPFAASQGSEVAQKFSPDGSWLAYASNQSGRYEVYVKSVSGPDGLLQVSNDGGNEPVWSRDGRELFFRTGSKLMAATISTKRFREVDAKTIPQWTA